MINLVRIFFVSALFLCPNRAIGQEVEHNYKVGPQSVTCDSLYLPDNDLPSALEAVKSASFRDVRQFKLTRKQGLQGGHYYSCNAATGYMIIRYDNEEQLYLNISKEFWNTLTTNADPDGVYLKNRHLWEKYL